MSNQNVLATVGSRKITENDVDMLIKNLPPETAAQFNTEEGKKRLLGELVNQELFYLDAINSGLDNDAEYLEEVENMKAAILKKHAVNKLLNGITADENEIRAFYEDNKQRFSNPESVKASHILVDTEQEAERILDEINAGKPFDKAAEEYSNCPSKSSGGDLGFFTPGRMVPEFEQAAFKLDIDQVSTPVKTQFGYHIIKVTDKKAAAVKTLDEVKNQIQSMLASNKQQETFYNKIDELKGKYEIKMNV